MAVTSIKEATVRYRSRSEITGSFQYQRQQRRTFRVQLDTISSRNAIDAKLADLSGQGGLRVPRLGDPHPVDLAARCTAVEAESVNDDPRDYLIVCEYKTFSGRGSNQDGEQAIELPLQRPPAVDIGTWTLRRPFTKDLQNRAVVSSAGEPFDPPLEQEVRATVLIYEHNVQSNPLTRIGAFRSTVNAAPFLIGAKFHAFVRDMTARHVFEAGQSYWRERIEIAFLPFLQLDGNGNEIGWQPYILDQGVDELNDDGDRVRITDADGNQVVTPVLLDGGGRARPGGPAVYLAYDEFRTSDFSNLGIVLPP